MPCYRPALCDPSSRWRTNAKANRKGREWILLSISSSSNVIKVGVFLQPPNNFHLNCHPRQNWYVLINQKNIKTTSFAELKVVGWCKEIGSFDFYSRSHVGWKMIVEFERWGRGLVGSGVEQERWRFDAISTAQGVRIVSVESLQLHWRELWKGGC